MTLVVGSLVIMGYDVNCQVECFFGMRLPHSLPRTDSLLCIRMVFALYMELLELRLMTWERI